MLLVGLPNENNECGGGGGGTPVGNIVELPKDVGTKEALLLLLLRLFVGVLNENDEPEGGGKNPSLVNVAGPPNPKNWDGALVSVEAEYDGD
jgi:hypothetical protein